MNKKTPRSRHLMTDTAIKLIAVSVIFTLTTGYLNAQQVYKSVDKNGRVTYSEAPPLPGSGDKLLADSRASVSLPYALQQIVSRYPVTLYTKTDCGPCISARLMLTQRGVPFTERTVSSKEDIAAYKNINSDNNLPLVTIAAQQLKGYQETEWTQYLDAAGYPQTSTLPSSYKNAEATSLTPKKAVEKAVKKTEEIAEKPAATRATRPSAAPQEPNNNPAGIKF